MLKWLTRRINAISEHFESVQHANGYADAAGALLSGVETPESLAAALDATMCPSPYEEGTAAALNDFHKRKWS